MIKRYNLTRQDFKNVGNADQWKPFLRKFEIDKIFDGLHKDYFDKALELGCGSGKYSKYLAFYCKKLIAIEYNKDRLTSSNDDKTTFMVADAQNLSQFPDNEMDLIFSSNLIEHLPQIGRCLNECRRVVKQEGLIVHTVPNRTWKFFHLLLYYPFGVKVMLWRLLSSKKALCLGEFIDTKAKLDSNLSSLDYSLKKVLWPKTHGISKSHFAEFRNWAEKRWINLFKNNGLEVVNIIRLPFYFGWDYSFRFILKLGNYLGLSSSTVFILKKTLMQ
jgi:ubiquinone/menaquinone biosynthesis C-methylase UbiE